MRTRLPTTMLVLGVLACSGGVANDDADTGRTDTRPLDATGDDAAVFDTSDDVSVDAALASDDPGWVRLDGFPDQCFVEFARQPEATLAFHWEPCLDDLAGCEMGVIDRAVAPLSALGGRTGHTDGRGVVVWSLRDEDATGSEYIVLTESDVARAAWRFPQAVGETVTCAVTFAANARSIGIDVWFTGRASYGHGIATAAWSDVASLASPWLVPPTAVAHGNYLQLPSTSGTTLADTLLDGRLLVVEGARWVHVPGPGSGAVVAGHDVFWSWSNDLLDTAIHVSNIDGRDDVLYTPRAGSLELNVASDGHDLVWREGPRDYFPGPFVLGELWTAAYATDATALAPRLVRDDLVSNDGTLGDGTYAYRAIEPDTFVSSAVVVDLGDGSERRYTLPGNAGPGGLAWGVTDQPLWVTRDEVVFPAFRRNDGEADLRTVLRIDLTPLVVDFGP